MKISVLSDSNWEAKVDHALRSLKIREEFEGRDYGADLRELIIVVNCRDPRLGHKQRIRFSPAAAKLSMDIMLPFDAMARSSHAERRARIAKSLCEEVARVLGSYRFRHFESGRFLQEFKTSVETDMLGADSARFDHLCAERAPGYAN